MYDVNPLALKMYLHELDRQAGPKLDPLQSTDRKGAGFAGFGGAVAAALRRLRPLVVGPAQARRASHPIHPLPARLQSQRK